MPVSYNEYVKRPLKEMEYTVEQIRELKNCNKDIYSFLKHVKIVHPDKGRIVFDPYDFQKDIIDTYLTNRFLILLLSRQTGKCVYSDTYITIRNKVTKKIEKIKIGDFYERMLKKSQIKFSLDKFIETLKNGEYEVLSDSGWKDFDGIGKTIKFQIYELELENHSKLKCADDHLVVTNTSETKYVKDLTPNDIIKLKNVESKIKSITKTNEFENMYDLLNVSGSLYYTNDILSHNSTVVGVIACWYAIFNEDKSIGITSYIEKEAISILDKIKIIYEELPEWIKPGVVEYNKKKIVFDNGTQIQVAATTKNAFRGKSLNLLVSDELAFVQPAQAEEFWSSNYPTVSKSKESKVILISTPKGQHNLFHRLWIKSITKGKNGKIGNRFPGPNGFVPIKYNWRCLPERTEKWAELERESLGELLFNQEHECDFLGSINTLIDTETLKKLSNKWINPILFDLQNCFRIYQKPINNAEYVLGVDTSKGIGGDYSTIQILRIDSTKPVKIEQVAVYESNKIDPYNFAEIVNRIGIYYNNAYIIVENNAEGYTVVTELHWHWENGGLVNTGNKEINLGIRATTKTKSRAVILMKKFIESGSLRLNDRLTIKQLTDFIEKSNGSFSCANLHDDLVSALYWACYIFKLDYLDEEMTFIKDEEEDHDCWGILGDTPDGSQEDWSWMSM